jgi:BlaI family transcriptional regulator, penicillinase repressor
MSSRAPEDPTPAEWQVLSLVWKAGALPTREVVAALQADTDWSVSTIKTLLRRLVDKGHLKTKAVGNGFIYSAKASPQSALRRAGEALLDRANDATVAPLLAHLVRKSGLRASELAELRALIDSLAVEPGAAPIEGEEA